MVFSLVFFLSFFLSTSKLQPPSSLSLFLYFLGKSLRRALVRSTLRVLRALTSAAEALSLGCRLQRAQAAAAAAVAAGRIRRRRRRSSSTDGDDGDNDENDDDENGDENDENDGGDARLVLRRFAEAGRDSYSLTLQAVIYYATLHVLSFFAIEKAIFAFRSDLERWVCRVGGVWHVTADGRKLPYTLPSAMDADFSTPGYNPGRGFPYGDGEEEISGAAANGANGAASTSSENQQRIPFARPDDPRNAHFASLFCKAVYEDSAVVADLVSFFPLFDLFLREKRAHERERERARARATARERESERARERESARARERARERESERARERESERESERERERERASERESERERERARESERASERESARARETKR